jgi:ABC-type uncharacterized transport system YnjBCD permease subunit
MVPIVALIIAAGVYWVLQDKEDARADREGKPRAASSKRIGLFLVLLAVIVVLSYLISSAFNSSTSSSFPKLDGGSSTGTMDHIAEGVRVGMPPF